MGPIGPGFADFHPQISLFPIILFRIVLMEPLPMLVLEPINLDII